MKKMRSPLLLLCTAAILFTAAGCSTVTENKVAENKVAGVQETDAVAHATPKGTGWMIEVSGVRSDEIWESNFEKWKTDPASGYGEYVFSRKGVDVTFSAMPLKNIIAVIDDSDATMPYSFDSDKWAEGYDITLTAGDGYSVTINTADVAEDAVYIADVMDGENIQPMVTGSISPQYWVKELAEISASLEPLSLENNDFELQLEIGGKTGAYKISELEDKPYYVEDRGNYTNSYGNTFGYLWGGVKIVELVNEYTRLSEAMTVTIEAMDGYAMSYSGSQLLDNSDGDWILAFKEDGAYMPEDPGYIRLVKVGPQNPNFTGHVSARMVKKIIIKDTAFRDFQLEIIDGKKKEVMDRQTLQSGVTTWRTVVNYFDRKAGETIAYKGMPVYELLGRYSGYETVKITAADGFEISLAADELEGNNDVIIAMFYGDGSELSDREFPLIIVWDENAEVIPAGIKAVRSISRITVE